MPRRSHALYFIAMNYTVHGLMYGYFALRALRCLPAWRWLPRTITALQILQMAAGVGVQGLATFYARDGGGCAIAPSNLAAGALMYGAYLALFLDFFFAKYGGSRAFAFAAAALALAVAVAAAAAASAAR